MRNLISNQVQITKENVSSGIYEIPESGKIIYRAKIDTFTDVPHPGIILGNDIWETIWIIHNHHKNGCVEIETIQEFSQGENIFYDPRPVFYSTQDVLDRAILHYLQKTEYNWLTNNCQHFINNVVQNVHYSETIDLLADRAMAAGGLAALCGAMIKNKHLLTAGLAVAGVGGLGKGLSRQKNMAV